MKAISVFALILCLVFAAVGSALAAGNTFRVTLDSGSDSGTWVYTLHNDNTDGIVPSALDIDWDQASAPADYDISWISSPDNWTPDSLSGYFFPAWNCDPSYPLLHGESVTGFTVTAPTAPMNFTVYTPDELGFDAVFETGTVTIPTQNAPEPGSLGALLTGATAMGGLLIRRRRS